MLVETVKTTGSSFELIEVTYSISYDETEN